MLTCLKYYLVRSDGKGEMTVSYFNGREGRETAKKMFNKLCEIIIKRRENGKTCSEYVEIFEPYISKGGQIADFFGLEYGFSRNYNSCSDEKPKLFIEWED